VRRFRCTRCHRTCSVRPDGVLARCAYSLAAILAAWAGAIEPPIGQGDADTDSYKRHGIDTLTPDRFRPGATRWRQLERWARRIPKWWPHRHLPAGTWRQTVRALLTQLTIEAHTTALTGRLARALVGLAGCGAAM